jgi:hypothetical protein
MHFVLSQLRSGPATWRPREVSRLNRSGGPGCSDVQRLGVQVELQRTYCAGPSSPIQVADPANPIQLPKSCRHNRDRPIRSFARVIRSRGSNSHSTRVPIPHTACAGSFRERADAALSIAARPCDQHVLRRFLGQSRIWHTTSVASHSFRRSSRRFGNACSSCGCFQDRQ